MLSTRTTVGTRSGPPGPDSISGAIVSAWRDFIQELPKASLT